MIDCFTKYQPFTVIDDECTGCTNCLKVGCPAILVTRRATEMRKDGKEIKKAWVRIDEAACTGCGLCPTTCGPDAIVPFEAAVAKGAAE